MSAPGHILYTFRRCPYAMRGRMGLSMAGLPVHVREVVLRDKPADMLAASPKGTVPVLVTTSGEVVDESLDVMRWSLAQNDPEGWLAADPETTDMLISRNDGVFKHAGDVAHVDEVALEMALENQESAVVHGAVHEVVHQQVQPHARGPCRRQWRGGS